MSEPIDRQGFTSSRSHAGPEAQASTQACSAHAARGSSWSRCNAFPRPYRFELQALWLSRRFPSDVRYMRGVLAECVTGTAELAKLR